MPGNLVVGLQLRADGRGFRGELRMSQRALDRLTGATRKGTDEGGRYADASRRVEQATRRAGQSFLAAHGHHARYLAGLLGVHQAVRAARAVARATIDQEQALAQVEARIRSTGGAAGLATAEVAAIATELQRVTTYGDEVILGAQSILLSFRGIGRENFGAATEGVLDLATAMRTDLRSAAIQLGKALDDPKRGLDALSRSGTTFTAAQKELIESLVESGRRSEALALILGELETQYGGAARAARETLGGALEALGNAIGDLTEVQSGSTEVLRLWIEGWTRAIERIDVADLHANLARLLTVGGAVAGLYAVRVTGGLVSAGVAAIRAAPQVQSAAAAVGVLGRSARYAAVGLRLLSGPGALLTLLAVAAYEVYDAVSRSREQIRLAGSDARDAARDVGELTREYRALTDAEREGAIAATERAIAGLANALDGIRRRQSAALAERRAAENELKRIQDDPSKRGAVGLGSVDLTDYEAVRRESDRARAAQEKLTAGTAEAALVHERLRVAEKRLAAQRAARSNTTAAPDAAAGVLDRAALDRVVAIRRQAEDRIARATLSRIELVDREERRQLDELAAAKAADVKGAQAIEAARNAIVRAAQLERDRIYREDLIGRERAQRAALDAARAARDEIGDALATPFRRAVREARRWGEETRAILTAAGAGAEELARVEEAVQQRIAAARREAAEAARDAAEQAAAAARAANTSVAQGFRYGFEALGRSAESAAELAASSVTGAFHSMEDALVDFVRTGKLEFSSLANSIVADLARIAIRQSITGPLFGWLSGLGAGGESFGAGDWWAWNHAGGVAGALGGVRRYLPHGAFADAPRFHRGGIAGQLRPDEVPTILQRGEEIIPESNPRHIRNAGMQSPSVHIEFVNRGTPQRQVGNATTRWDGRRWVVGIVVDDLSRGGPIRRAIRGLA